jgi:hypothetical protein
MLDNDKISLVLKRDTDLLQEMMGRLSDDHGRHELTSEPSASSGSDACFDDGDDQVGSSFGERVGAGETAEEKIQNSR